MTNSQFHKYVRAILLSSAVILLAAGCGGQSGQRDPGLDGANLGQTQSQGSQNNPGGVQKAPAVSVTQSVQQSNLNNPNPVQLPEGENAIDLLRRGHTVEVKEYPGLGEFVTSIDGIKPDAKHFWSLYVNGQVSQVGASSYKPKDGDRIEWKLEAIK